MRWRQQQQQRSPGNVNGEYVWWTVWNKLHLSIRYYIEVGVKIDLYKTTLTQIHNHRAHINQCVMYRKRIAFNKHHKRFSEKWLQLLYLLVLLALKCSLVSSGCRDQERDQCETVCIMNATTNQYNCNLRAVVILPNNTQFESSLPKVSCIYTKMLSI